MFGEENDRETENWHKKERKNRKREGGESEKNECCAQAGKGFFKEENEAVPKNIGKTS